MKPVLLAISFFVAAAVRPGAAESLRTVLNESFDGAAGPLNGQRGWVSRNDAVQTDGAGMAVLAVGADAYVKHPVEIPSDAAKVRLSAWIHAIGMPNSDGLTYHPAGKNPAWVALGLIADPNPDRGLANARLSLVLSSDGRQLSLGLGRGVGREPQPFGIHEAAGGGWCDVALEYDFRTQTAAAFLNGEKVLSGSVKLTPADFKMAGFQLRRIAAQGGVDWLKVEADGKFFDPVVLERESGVRINTEHERNKALVARINSARTPAETLAVLKEGWNNPPSTYRPHTRWWWPGNAVTKEGIDFQLQEMKDKGFGGVEIMSFMSVFTKGNIDFNSDEFVEMTKYAVDKARELGMHVTPALVPGWGHGHADVPPEDGAKAMTVFTKNVEGGPLALPLTGWEPRDARHHWGSERAMRRFEALVAVALDPDGHPDPARRINLTAHVQGDRHEYSTGPDLRVETSLPAGRWQLASFWTALTGQKNAAADSSHPTTLKVDHMNRDAVGRYLEVSGARFAAAIGGDYGQTVDSFFGDSWEVLHTFAFWSDGLFDRFEKEKGYDLRPWLPLLIHDGAAETPYVRYDFGHFLHLIGMESIVHPLAEYAARNNVAMRQQPHYRFTADIIEQSGVFQRPETENTKSTFEPMFWHKLTTSGTWLYPSDAKKWVSAEAFTFVNEKYLTTMEEIKRGTDLFIRDGVTQFYNHGYFYTPEMELAPSRDIFWMVRASHVNTWWPWYRGLADYQARTSFLARQGRPVCNVLVYAPYPTMWSERTEHPAHQVRDLPFGPLPKILVANGYDFDFVNDDLLLNHARIEDGKIAINGFEYPVLILPRALTLAPESLEKIAAFVESGGTVMALGALPQRSTGLANHEANDARLFALRDDLFEPAGGMKASGRGETWYFPGFEGLEYLTGWNPTTWPYVKTPPLEPVQAEFVRALRDTLVPEFEIADKPQSDGLTFRHTKIGEVDCWFITNLQPVSRRTEVTLATKDKTPVMWDAMTGSIEPLEDYRFAPDGRIIIPVDMQPWESLFVLLADDALPSDREPVKHQVVSTIPVDNGWDVSFQGLGGFSKERSMQTLVDWTTVGELKNFSGTATYVTTLDLQSEAAKSSRPLVLDLGRVHEVASVRINGREAGKVWMQPYRVDISGLVKPGPNKVEITVANLLWNWVAGLEEPTEVPVELQAHYGTGSHPRYNGWNHFLTRIKSRITDLQPSGLLGPVRLIGE